MSTDGYLQVEEGVLYWVFDCPTTSQTHTNSTLLFIHAAVADHTLWENQVEHFTAEGYYVLRYDMFGFGKSLPSEEFLGQSTRRPVRHHEHTAEIVRNWRQIHEASSGRTASADDSKIVVIGLSRGGATAVDFALSYPDLVRGLVVAAGGLSEFYAHNLPEEDEVFTQEESLFSAREAENLARLRVKIWGDGPLQRESQSGQ